MDRIINKYNAVAFYTEVLEEQEEAPLYSGHRRLLPWQVELNTTEASGGVTATIVAADLSTVQSIPGGSITNTATSGGKSYVTFRSTSDLSPVLNEGVYRIKLTTGSDTYYSHPICVSNAFQQMEFQILPVCVSASGGGFSISLADFSKSADMESNWEVDYGTGYTWVGGETSGSINSSDIVGSGAVTLPLRRNVFYPDGSLFYKEYTLSTNTSGCSGSSLSTPSNGGRGYDNYCYLKFTNTKDLSDLGLFYQNSYTQRVYFHAAFDFPTPVTEESFLQNGENDLYLESAAIAEQINIDIHPLPDYLITVLQAVRYHDTVTLVTCADEKQLTLTNFNFTTRTAENDTSVVGRITAEIKRVFIKGCEENLTTI